jgi:hypothetical protein
VDGEMKRTGTPVELRDMVERAGLHAASLLFA